MFKRINMSKWPPTILADEQQTSSNLKANFQSSLKPIVIWMRIFGIRSTSEGIFFWRLVEFLVLVLPMFAINCFVTWTAIDRFISVFPTRQEICRIGTELERTCWNEWKLRAVSTAHYIVEFVLDFLTVPGAHLALYLISLSQKWKEMWNLLTQIQDAMQFGQIFHRNKIKRICYISLALILLV